MIHIITKYFCYHSENIYINRKIHLKLTQLWFIYLIINYSPYTELRIRNIQNTSKTISHYRCCQVDYVYDNLTLTQLKMRVYITKQFCAADKLGTISLVYVERSIVLNLIRTRADPTLSSNDFVLLLFLNETCKLLQDGDSAIHH